MYRNLGCLQPDTYSIELDEKDSRIVCYLKIGFLPKQTRFILSKSSSIQCQYHMMAEIETSKIGITHIQSTLQWSVEFSNIQPKSIR